MAAVVVVLAVLLELDVVVAAGGHNRSTRFPASAWPNNKAGEMLGSSHTAASVASTVAMPLTHAAEQALPGMKSSVVQPDIWPLYARMHAIGTSNDVMSSKLDSERAEAVEAVNKRLVHRGDRDLL